MLFSLALGGGGHIGCKFPPDSLGIHVIKVFPHNGLAHVTEQTFAENTIHIIIFNLNNSKLSASLLGLEVGWRISSQSWALA